MVDLTTYTTLRTPTKAKALLEIFSADQLKTEIAKGTFKKPFFILGSGANVLFTKNFPGTVIINKLNWENRMSSTSQSTTITVASGKSWHETVMTSVANSWSGLENMALIPGTVGAAVTGNIAAYGQNQEDVFESLVAINLNTGKSETFTKSDCQFSYRESIFKHQLMGKYFITSVTYRLSRTAHLELSYSAKRHASLLPQLQKIATPPYTIKDVAQAVINLRNEKLPDWTTTQTAGSFFKNPVVTIAKAEALKKIIPDLQTYPAEKLSYIAPQHLADYVKIPAGMLLDELGWKGKRTGNVGTSPQHALVIIAYPGATGEEIYSFSENMRSSVSQKFDINLEYEVIVV